MENLEVLLSLSLVHNRGLFILCLCIMVMDALMLMMLFTCFKKNSVYITLCSKVSLTEHYNNESMTKNWDLARKCADVDATNAPLA